MSYGRLPADTQILSNQGLNEIFSGHFINNFVEFIQNLILDHWLIEAFASHSSSSRRLVYSSFDEVIDWAIRA